MNRYCTQAAVNRRRLQRRLFSTLVLLILLFLSHVVWQMSIGKRFTYEDGLMLWKLCGEPDPTGMLAPHYGEERTEFRRFLRAVIDANEGE